MFVLAAQIAASGPLAAATPPRIAIIIDDIGNQLVNGKRAVELYGPVACAVLPQTPYGERLARLAHANGKEVLLHLPLQPVTQLTATAAGMIRIDTTHEQLTRILNVDLASVPFVVGVNNHQGSLLTQHPGHMQWLMQALRAHGNLFFVDSYTSKASVALRLARENGVPSIRRDVFLDNTPTRAAIDSEFQRLKALARTHGVAVGIGHPHDVTLDYLQQALPRLGAEGYELVAVTAAIGAARGTVVRTAGVTRTAHER